MKCLDTFLVSVRRSSSAGWMNEQTTKVNQPLNNTLCKKSTKTKKRIDKWKQTKVQRKNGKKAKKRSKKTEKNDTNERETS